MLKRLISPSFRKYTYLQVQPDPRRQRTRLHRRGVSRLYIYYQVRKQGWIPWLRVAGLACVRRMWISGVVRITNQDAQQLRSCSTS